MPPKAISKRFIALHVDGKKNGTTVANLRFTNLTLNGTTAANLHFANLTRNSKNVLKFSFQHFCPISTTLALRPIYKIHFTDQIDSYSSLFEKLYYN